MLRVGSHSRIADNSGVILVRCISILRRKVVDVGSLLTVFVKKKRKLRKTVKKDLLNAVALQTRQYTYRAFGDYYIRSDRGAIALVNNEIDQFLGTKVYSPLRLELFLRRNVVVPNLIKHFRHVV